jgi:hypothetical protein
LLFLAVGFLSLAPAASAQEYATETGPLELDVTVTVTLTIAGEGFVANSIVYVTASADGVEIDLGTLPTDDQGRFFGEVSLPQDLDPGSFVIAATGVTAQGATLVLSTPLGVDSEVPALAASDTTSTSSSSPGSTTPRPPRGDGLDPIETTEAPEELPGGDRTGDLILIAIVGASAIGINGVWWWLYRMKQS